MKIEPRVSFVVPVYNVQRYLDDCLLSIRNQTVNDIEIICVDDASTDSSFKILEKHASEDERIKIVSHTANSGLAVARNTGLVHVRAPWVVFIDSDDLVSDRLCESCLAAVKENKTDVVFFNYISFLDGHSPVFDMKRATAVAADRRILLGLQAFAWTKFIRVEFLQKAQIFFPPGLLMQDVPVHWRLVLESRSPLQLFEQLMFYRQRESSVSYRSDWSRADGLKVYDMVSDYLVQSHQMEKWAQVFCSRQMTYFYELYITYHSRNRSLLGKALAEIRSRVTPFHWNVALGSTFISSQCRDFILSSCRPVGCDLIASQLVPSARHHLRNLLRSFARFLRSVRYSKQSL